MVEYESMNKPSSLVPVFFTSWTTLAGRVASQTTDFPRPMIQFMAADFLSVQ